MDINEELLPSAFGNVLPPGYPLGQYRDLHTGQTTMHLAVLQSQQLLKVCMVMTAPCEIASVRDSASKCCQVKQGPKFFNVLVCRVKCLPCCPLVFGGCYIP